MFPLFLSFGFFFFFNDTATTEIYTLSLHDALPISVANNAAGISNNCPVDWLKCATGGTNESKVLPRPYGVAKKALALSAAIVKGSARGKVNALTRSLHDNIKTDDRFIGARFGVVGSNDNECGADVCAASSNGASSEDLLGLGRPLVAVVRWDAGPAEPGARHHGRQLRRRPAGPGHVLPGGHVRRLDGVPELHRSDRKRVSDPDPEQRLLRAADRSAAATHGGL